MHSISFFLRENLCTLCLFVGLSAVSTIKEEEHPVTSDIQNVNAPFVFVSTKSTYW